MQNIVHCLNSSILSSPLPPLFPHVTGEYDKARLTYQELCEQVDDLGLERLPEVRCRGNIHLQPVAMSCNGSPAGSNVRLSE